MTTTDHAQATGPGTDRLITPEEVAVMLGGGNITAATVKHRWKHWGLHAAHVGKFLRFRQSDVHAYMDSATSHPAPLQTPRGTGHGPHRQPARPRPGAAPSPRTGAPRPPWQPQPGGPTHARTPAAQLPHKGRTRHPAARSRQVPGRSCPVPQGRDEGAHLHGADLNSLVPKGEG